MGIFGFLKRLFFPPRPVPPAEQAPSSQHEPEQLPDEVPLQKVQLTSLRYARQKKRRHRQVPKEASSQPYQFAQFSVEFDGYLDLSQDVKPQRLEQWGLPLFSTPEQLADWLGMPVGKVAWLIDRFTNSRPENERSAHYVYRWLRKRKGGYRLIESPKATLKQVQEQILTDILERIPAHDAAHGFVPGRSILTNAEPHVGKRVVVKLDLQNFYGTVTFSRVVAIYRTIGYSREAAIWLARLTTSMLPPSMKLPKDGGANARNQFLGRHLPQGAPTSPALANLSAYSLDVRLAGMAKRFGAKYTRYADDLTFSGPQGFIDALPVFLPLVTRIVRSERFRLHPGKRKVIRNNHRQTVTGVVVNQRPNIARKDYDQLKAILTNCIRTGPAQQNRENVEHFAAHLRGRVAHVQQLNPARGEKLLSLYRQIVWAD